MQIVLHILKFELTSHFFFQGRFQASLVFTNVRRRNVDPRLSETPLDYPTQTPSQQTFVPEEKHIELN